MANESLTVNWSTLERRGISDSVWRRRWIKFRRHAMSLAGMAILVLLVLLALLAPFFTSDPNKVELSEAIRLKPPSANHWFGTDHLGRDVLARSLYGARISLLVGFLSTGMSIVTGTLLGSVAGFYGGPIDSILTRLIDVVLSLPLLFLLIILQSLLTQPSLLNVILVLSFTSWMGTARIVRAQVLKEREMDYVVAAHSIGASTSRIITRHLLPNVIGSVIVIATLQVGRLIILEAALSYLGFGVPRPHASWGSMLAEARGYLNTGPWMALFPGFLLSLTVLSFNFVGDGLTSAIDPHENS